MQLNHVALFCASEEKSDLFYMHILGLEKAGTKQVPRALAKDIFDLDREYKIINYANKEIKFEIFIRESHTFPEKGVDHTCIEVENRESFLKRCAENGAEIRKIPKGDSFLVFIKDFDGNLFEIKEKT